MIGLKEGMIAKFWQLPVFDSFLTTLKEFAIAVAEIFHFHWTKPFSRSMSVSVVFRAVRLYASNTLCPLRLAFRDDPM